MTGPLRSDAATRSPVSPQFPDGGVNGRLTRINAAAGDVYHRLPGSPGSVSTHSVTDAPSVTITRRLAATAADAREAAPG